MKGEYFSYETENASKCQMNACIWVDRQLAGVVAVAAAEWVVCSARVEMVVVRLVREVW
jgi:hypothetical protein